MKVYVVMRQYWDGTDAIHEICSTMERAMTAKNNLKERGPIEADIAIEVWEVK